MTNEKTTEKLKRIKLVVCDIDGTLTDGTVYYSARGEEVKRFSIRDGMGVELLRHGGIIPAIMTSENSPIVTARANKLKIEHVVLGARNKRQKLIELLESLSIDADETAFLGDDINDLPAMTVAGFKACPADAVEAVKSVADLTLQSLGGFGALRELSELILLSQNKSLLLPENW